MLIVYLKPNGFALTRWESFFGRRFVLVVPTTLTASRGATSPIEKAATGVSFRRQFLTRVVEAAEN